MATESIYVTLIEDTERFSEIYKIIIEKTPGFACAGAYTDCESALLNLEADDPDVILLDIELGKGKMTGIEGVKMIKEALPEAQVVMLTVHEDSNDYIFNSLCNGAVGYLTKDVSPDDLIAAIKQAHKGGAPMSPAIARKVVNHFQSPESPGSGLTSQEKKVLRLAAQDKLDKEIAEVLCITRETVRFHFKNIYQKLQVHSKHGAVGQALKKGLL